MGDSRLFDRVSLRTEPEHVASTIGWPMTGETVGEIAAGKARRLVCSTAGAIDGGILFSANGGGQVVEDGEVNQFALVSAMPTRSSMVG